MIQLLGFQQTNSLMKYKEAKELGITTKPVIAGPYTVLKLCRFTENKGIDDF